jgi:hypothetical protein
LPPPSPSSTPSPTASPSQTPSATASPSLIPTPAWSQYGGSAGHSGRSNAPALLLNPPGQILPL